MSRDQQSLLDMQTMAQEILRFTAGMDQADLAADRRTQAAVLYDILIIGEAANRLSEEFRKQHAILPWKDIIGMRNIVAHQYDGVNVDIIWQVIQQDIPALLAMIAPLLSAD